MKNYMTLLAAVVFTGVLTSNEAASISSNIEGAMICPGEELILTCTSHGTSQRWIIRDEDGNDIEANFASTSTSDEQRLVTRVLNMMSFQFALVSVAYDHFESTVSAIVTEEINNTRVECTGRFSRDLIVLKTIGVPVSPQGLLSRVLESGSDYLVIEVTWDTPDPDLDSRTDFYHYKVLDGLQEENASVVLDFNTTNTTVIIDLNGLNTALFVLSAWNCEGASTPAAIVIHNGRFTTSTYFPQTTSPTDSETDSPERIGSLNFVTTTVTVALGSCALFTIVGIAVAFTIFKLTMFRKQRKEGAVASEVHQAYHESVPPIYETVNSEKSDESHNNNFGTHVDTITSDDPEGVCYENIHSQEIMSCRNSSTRIDTAANVAYNMTSSEIPMQNNHSYQAVHVHYH